MLSHDFGAGFADPVRDAQGCFRAVLDALAHPGKPQKLLASGQRLGPLDAQLASIMLTLSDHDTPIWLSAALREDAVSGFVGFHTGAPIVDDPERANFAFVAFGDPWPKLAQCNLGTDAYPDRSTTIVAEISALTGGPRMMLAGPGIAETQEFSPAVLPGDFSLQWSENRRLFPRGVDLLLIADDQVIGLPRSSRIVEG